MFKKLIAAAALSLLSSGAFAACTNPLAIKDGGSNTVSMSVVTNTDGFCAYNFNMALINGVVPLMGNGVTGTGSPRVTIASDNTAFTVNLGTIGGASLAATQGGTTDAPATVPTSATAASEIALLKAIANVANSATPAGSAIIGKVGIDQTTPGTTNGVSQNAATPVTATLQSAAVANGNGTVLSTNGMSAAVLTVGCASCSGGTTINFEGSEDATNYASLSAVQLGTTTIAGSTTAAGFTLWEVPVSGLQNIRARISAYSAGTITITGHSVPVPWDPKTVNANVVSNSATNQSVNLAQVAGVATPVGSGVQATAPRTTLATDSPGIIAMGPNTVANSLPVAASSQYPTNATTTTPTPITGNSTGAAGAVVGTLAAAASVTTYICGFTVDAVGGTAAIGPITVAGLIGNSMVFQLFSSATGATKTQTFNPCIPASAANTAITVTTTANGTATAVDVNSWGYRL